MPNTNQKHPISLFQAYGELKFADLPTYAKIKVDDLFSDAEPCLHTALNTSKNLLTEDFSDYKSEVANRMKTEKLLAPRTQLHEVLRKHITESQKGINRINGRILKYSKPTLSDDPNETLNQSLKFQEIRSILRNKDVQERKALIQKGIEKNDPSFLIATVDGPDDLLPAHTLNELRQDHAFRQEPDLQIFKHQVERLAEIIRQKSAEINSTMCIIYAKNHQDDPLSKESHFETFTPKNERDRVLAGQIIAKEKKSEFQLELKAEHARRNKGISL